MHEKPQLVLVPVTVLGTRRGGWTAKGVRTLFYKSAFPRYSVNNVHRCPEKNKQTKTGFHDQRSLGTLQEVN